jgi:hypothetical protein
MNIIDKQKKDFVLLKIGQNNISQWEKFNHQGNNESEHTNVQKYNKHARRLRDFRMTAKHSNKPVRKGLVGLKVGSFS